MLLKSNKFANKNRDQGTYGEGILSSWREIVKLSRPRSLDDRPESQLKYSIPRMYTIYTECWPWKGFKGNFLKNAGNMDSSRAIHEI